MVPCTQYGCLSCLLTTPATCTVCNSNLMFHPTLGCIPDYICPDTKYRQPTTNFCQNCPSQCRLCSKPSTNVICDECIPSTNLWRADLAGVFTCQVPCTLPEQWHKLSNSCKLCSTETTDC